MISRRDILLGGACVAGAMASYALTPRKRLSLQGDRRLTDIVPSRFGSWSSRDASDLVAPATEGGLVASLYDDLLQRVYTRREDNAEIMVLMAHGPRQTNDLQLHRPETCYPAFGFEIVASSVEQLLISKTVQLPVHRLLAEGAGHREAVVYWTRLGEDLPVLRSEQRLDRLKLAARGYVADGLLARCSIQATQKSPDFNLMQTFISELIRATKAENLSALIGSVRARALAA